MSLSSKNIWPPWFSIAVWAIDNPNPVPPVFVPRASSRRTNGRIASRLRLSGIPMPSSSIVIVTESGASVSVMRIALFAYRAAFSIMLLNARANAIGRA